MSIENPRQEAGELRWHCSACGADRWVGWRAGPEHEGYPRKAQCVPCGHVQELPADTPRVPELWFSPGNDALYANRMASGKYLQLNSTYRRDLPSDVVKLGDARLLEVELAAERMGRAENERAITQLVGEREEARRLYREALGTWHEERATLARALETAARKTIEAERERDALRADIRTAIGGYFDVDIDEPDPDNDIELDQARRALKAVLAILDREPGREEPDPCCPECTEDQSWRLEEMTDVTRFEIIDQTGRRLVLNDVTDVRLDYQDDGRTLKVFLRDVEKAQALRRLAEELGGAVDREKPACGRADADCGQLGGTAHCGGCRG